SLNVPTPRQRPYDLGQDDTPDAPRRVAAAREPTREVARAVLLPAPAPRSAEPVMIQTAALPAARGAQPVSTFNTRFGDQVTVPASRETVSAFAPRFDGVMTGRGLY